jgi:rubrerythrin
MFTTIDDLMTVIGEEAQIRFHRYREFVNQAEKLGHRQVAKLLRTIIASEKGRLNLYHKCLTSLDDSMDVYDYYVCPKCGLALAENAPERCLLCETPGDQFIRIS